MTRFYLVPMVYSGASRGPKYLWVPPRSWALPCQVRDYGAIDVALAAVDGDASDHATLAGRADVFAFPEDLEAEVGRDARGLRTFLAGHTIPDGWLQQTDTYREVLRGLHDLFDMAQRFNGRRLADGKVSRTDRRVDAEGVRLDTEARDLPTDYRREMESAMDDLHVSRSGLRADSTLREYLERAASRRRAFSMMGEEV